ncbi:hypothetical protein [Streptomyces sp. NPDC056105]|uniref:hypothetical protein n=1 Tax=Streptomyces sp. NPDC056105 TaxID=3345714 RepID=UPI0035DF9D40
MATVIETRPMADAEQDELATVDSAYTRAFGADMAAWDVEVRDLYDAAIDEVFARYPKPVAS